MTERQFAGNAIDRLLLGWNPFAGVDHFVRDRARARNFQMAESRLGGVFRRAIEAGVGGFTYTAGPEATRLLGLIDSAILPKGFGLYPLVPSTMFTPGLMGGGMVRAASEMLKGLSSAKKASLIFSGGWAMLTRDPLRAVRPYVDVEVERARQSIPDQCLLRTLILSEIITDALVSFDVAEPAMKFIDAVTEDHGLMAGFETRNLVRFINFAEANRIDLSETLVMTPLNPVGFQMTPTKSACEEALASHPDLRVIAMSVLAAGQIRPEEASLYLKQFSGVRSIAVGTSNESHASETFRVLSSVFA